MRRLIEKMMAPLKRRVMNMVARAVIHLVNDAYGVQQLQIGVLNGEVVEAVERIQEYGFSSVPLPGALGVVIAVGGNRDHPLVIATDDDRHRPRGLKSGDVAIYDHREQIVILREDGIHIEGRNIIFKTDGVIRLEGDGLEFNAATYRQDDINGFGQRRTHVGDDKYEDDTYRTGATVTGSTEHGIDPAHIPSDHPEAP